MHVDSVEPGVLRTFIGMRRIMEVRGNWREEDRRVKTPKEKSLKQYRQSSDVGLTRILFHRRNSNPLFSTLYLFPLISAPPPNKYPCFLLIALAYFPFKAHSSGKF